MSKLRPEESVIPAADTRFGIVVSRWNGEITESLLKGALDTLATNGFATDSVTLCRVPGAFELPLAALKLAETGRVDAVIALGCVIQGDTPHFDYVCSECTRGIGEVGLRTGLPVAFGLLTCDTLEQAQVRSGNNDENKGREAALTAMEMVALLHTMAQAVESQV